LEKIKEVEVLEIERLDNTKQENQGFGSTGTGTQELRRTEESNILEEDIRKAYQSTPMDLGEKTLTNPPPTFAKDKDGIWY
jgi:hypothetical protein